MRIQACNDATFELNVDTILLQNEKCKLNRLGRQNYACSTFNPQI